MGDSSGGRDRERLMMPETAREKDREREREKERDRERLMMLDTGREKDSHSSVHSPAPLSPLRNDDFDYQQSNITLLKAQLKLVTHERDVLKKDVKRISGERDGAYRHLSLSSSPQSSMDSHNSSHHRTNSDTASTIAKSGASSTLSRSHSIASAGDKSLVLAGANSGFDKTPDRLLHELQMSKKQNTESLKKVDSAMKDMEYYRQEAENLRSRYNDVILEKQRMEQEVTSLRRFREEDRKEMSELRRQHQEVLTAEGGPGESMSIMYGTLLRKYETYKEDYALISKRYDDLVASHGAAVAKLEDSKEDIIRYKKQYEDMLSERNKFKQQCTQAIRQWDQALRERNDFRDALSKLQRQHEDDVKEINTAMAVRIKASKDIKRLTEERNAAMQEYSMIMSERDSVHKEIERLQNEVAVTNHKLKEAEMHSKKHDEEKRKLVCQIELLKRELDAALVDRDKALTVDLDSRTDYRHKKLDIDKHKKERYSLSSEHLASSTTKDGSDEPKSENLDDANSEIDRLRKTAERLQVELQDAAMEADVAKGRRDWAFSERDKVVLERESIRTLCDKLRRERDRAVSELAEALRDLDEGRKTLSNTSKENKEMKEKLESCEKESRIRLLQRNQEQSYSRDSAIDADLQDWETETLDLDLGLAGSDDDLGLDLAGGRDDPGCSQETPIYIASINKGSIVQGKLQVNDCILRVNNLDCRNVDRSIIMNTLRSGSEQGSTVSLMVRRRRTGRRYQALLHVGESGDHGLALDTGIYVSRISSGSAAARESGIAVGDRVLAINDTSMDLVNNVEEATTLLNHSLRSQDTLTITLQKSYTIPFGPHSSSSGPLSSSSSGHAIMEEYKAFSAKSISTTASPIKETTKHGSRDLVKKPWGHFTETVKEKLETVRGRRHSKEQSERDRQDTSDRSHRSDEQNYSHHSAEQNSDSDRRYEAETITEKDKEDAMAELDSVLNSFHLGRNGKNGSGKKKRKDRDSFRNGGTWPRARGGPMIEQATGTILHPKKHKERPHLKELLTNVPKYPLEQQEKDVVIYRGEERYPRSKRRDYRATTYDLISGCDEDVTSQGYHHQVSRDSSLGERLKSLSRDGSEDRKDYITLTPSDTSIDDSVKSGNVGKDVLLNYLKKSRTSRMTPSDSDHTSPVGGQISPAAPISYKPEMSKSAGDYYHMVNPSLLARSGTSGFSPYSPAQVPGPQVPTHSTHALYQHLSAPPYSTLQHVMSSPRYSSPPPLLPAAASGESILGSPIPRAYHDDHRSLYPPLEPPHSFPSISPTAGLYHHSPSPSLEMLSGKSRSMMHHLPHHPLHSYPAPTSVTPAHGVFVPGPTKVLGHSHGSSSLFLPNQYGYRLPEDSIPSTNDSRRYGTELPAGRMQRVRIPSNPSVGSKGSVCKISSTTSIDRPVSERSSPMPSYHVEILSPGSGEPRPAYTQEYGQQRKPSPGEIRQIHIEKSSEQLGIKIEESSGAGSGTGGVFVSSVSTNSLASQVGLQVGDQLLEVCGINLRMANYTQAAQVLHRVGNSIDIKVQYNPDKFHEGSDSESESDSSDEDSSSRASHMPPSYHSPSPSMPSLMPSHRTSSQRSGSPTPRNSPKTSHAAPLPHEEPPPSTSSTLRSPLHQSLPPSAHSTLTRHQVNQMVSQLARNPPTTTDDHDGKPPNTFNRHANPPANDAKTSTSFRDKKSPQYHDPRLVFPILKKSGDLGVRLVGGNAVGIFIHSVEKESPAYHVGLRSADQILEYNGTDLRQATAEQAAYELAKPAENVSVLVQYNLDKYNAIKDQPGDSYYVKAMFDRLPDSTDPLLLRFAKDDILYVDNTMYNGVPGHWSAWIVDQEGQKGHWGIIPSKYKVEEELLLKRGHGELEGEGSRRSSTSTRRSFFKRRKGGRSSSRDSKELASYSDAASLSYSDSGTLHEDPQIFSYIRVDRLDYLVTRPVLILGPLADAVVDKLVSDYPHRFVRCQPEYMDCNLGALEKGVMENIFVDFRRRGSHYECTTVSSIRSICDRNQHCVLDVHIGAVERLRHNRIYPIVLLIKFKSVKQIKEVKDPRYHAEKINQKDAKNIYEHTLKLECEYKHLISDIIHAGANLMLMCAQIATKIDQEQNKTLWVPSGTIW